MKATAERKQAVAAFLTKRILKYCVDEGILEPHEPNELPPQTYACNEYTNVEDAQIDEDHIASFAVRKTSIGGTSIGTSIGGNNGDTRRFEGVIRHVKVNDIDVAHFNACTFVYYYDPKTAARHLDAPYAYRTGASFRPEGENRQPAAPFVVQPGLELESAFFHSQTGQDVFAQSLRV